MGQGVLVCMYIRVSRARAYACHVFVRTRGGRWVGWGIRTLAGQAGEIARCHSSVRASGMHPEIEGKLDIYINVKLNINSTANDNN